MDGTKILIADDHPLIRNGIVTMLRNVEDFLIVGEAEDGQTAVLKTKELLPDVLIIDISMPNMSGIEATRIISKKFSSVKILVLSMHEEEEYVLEMLRSGAKGYIAKTAEKDELVAAIRAIHSGESYYGSNISQMMIEKYLSMSGARNDQTRNEIPLTKREQQILELIAQGLTTKEISQELCISPRTVDTHRTNLMRKLELRNTAGLVRFAVERKLILSGSTEPLPTRS